MLLKIDLVCYLSNCPHDLVPFRGVGLGVQASASGRNDGLDAPLHQLGVEAVAVIGSVRDQRVGPGFP